MNKEAITPLEEALDYKGDYAYNFIRKKIKQVLAILKEQPPTGEFTEANREDYERRLKAHSAGEAVKGFCRACQKPFWNVDDEDITCPFCGWKGFPVPDIDAEQIA